MNDPERLDVEINPDPESTRDLGADAVVIEFKRGRTTVRIAGRAVVTAEVAHALVLGLLLTHVRVDELAEEDPTVERFAIKVFGTHWLVEQLKRQAEGQGGEAN